MKVATLKQLKEDNRIEIEKDIDGDDGFMVLVEALFSNGSRSTSAVARLHGFKDDSE